MLCEGYPTPPDVTFCVLEQHEHGTPHRDENGRELDNPPPPPDIEPECPDHGGVPRYCGWRSWCGNGSHWVYLDDDGTIIIDEDVPETYLRNKLAEAEARLSRTCDGECDKAKEAMALIRSQPDGPYQAILTVDKRAYLMLDRGSSTLVPLTYCWCGGKLEAPGA